MRTSAPPLLAIFRSQLQGELLARVLFARTPGSVSDLARALDAPIATVAREVSRLADAGLLTTTRFGRALSVTANETNPAVAPLRDLVLIAFGPKQVVSDQFGKLDGLDQLYIFGSWAARYLGVEGTNPNDIDVLLVGHPDRDETFEAADRATRVLGRDVNPTIVSAERWASDHDLFLKQIKQRPILELPVGTAGTAGNGMAT